MRLKTEGITAYREIIIYYFSGTGNARNIALWLAKSGEEMGIKCLLVNIGETDRLSISQPDPEALVIFISPVHGFNYPPVMLNFLMRFPKGKNKVLLMNTRAGMLIGRWITPGLSGLSLNMATLVLRLKGFSIKAMVPFDMPSNWLSIHPALNDRTIKYLHERNMAKVMALAARVFSGKSDFRALYDIIQDVLISPVSLGYYFAGRFFFAKSFYSTGDCNNCNVCIRGCPVKAIIKVDNRPFWTFNCESCMKCMSLCPKKSIETGHGFITGYLILFYTIILVLFYRYFGMVFFTIENGILKFITETILMLAFLGLWYRIIHFLMRFRFFERLMIFSSLTSYRFWGRRYRALNERMVAGRHDEVT